MISIISEETSVLHEEMALHASYRVNECTWDRMHCILSSWSIRWWCSVQLRTLSNQKRETWLLFMDTTVLSQSGYKWTHVSSGKAWLLDKSMMKGMKAALLLSLASAFVCEIQHASGHGLPFPSTTGTCDWVNCIVRWHSHNETFPQSMENHTPKTLSQSSHPRKAPSTNLFGEDFPKLVSKKHTRDTYRRHMSLFKNFYDIYCVARFNTPSTPSWGYCTEESLIKNNARIIPCQKLEGEHLVARNSDLQERSLNRGRWGGRHRSCRRRGCRGTAILNSCVR